MLQYVQDVQGVWWKKDHFSSYEEKRDPRTKRRFIVAEFTPPGKDHDVEVRFDFWQWEEPTLGEPIITPAEPGYTALYSWIDEEGSLAHVVLPVIAWRHFGHSSAQPIAVGADNFDDEDAAPAVVAPNGFVFHRLGEFATVQEFLTSREAVLVAKRMAEDAKRKAAQ